MTEGRVTLLGVRFHNLARDEVVRRLEGFIAERSPRLVCTPNADHLLLAREDEEFRRVVDAADLTVADGMGVVYASRVMGTPLKENVGGRLLVEVMAERAAKKGYKLFLLGGRDRGAAATAAARLRELNPGLGPVSFHVPPMAAEFGPAETDLMIAAVTAAQPDVLFMAVGTPKQEKWLARNLGRLNVPVSIGVGAAVDIISGRVRRPPQWMTRVGLEWLFRLAQEPTRLFGRYVVRGSRFVGLVVGARLRRV